MTVNQTIRTAFFFSLALAAVMRTALTAAAQQLNEPLPLEVAASLHSHVGRSSFQLSPSGDWLAHTSARDETLTRDTPWFSATGKSFGEGAHRMQANLTNTRTGEVVRLGGQTGSSWGPVWSPNGERVAFYADDDGEAGVWIWERATGEAWRFPDVIARSFFGFETLRWSADSRHILAKILPAGMSVAGANALLPRGEGGRAYPPAGPDEPSVFVLKSEPGEDQEEEGPTEVDIEGADWAIRSMADLAILDLRDRTVTRIAARANPSWYAYSPDESRIAYTDLQGWETDSQQPVYDIRVYDLGSRGTRTIATNVRLAYGIEVSWSPDGGHLAYIRSGQVGDGVLVVLSVADGAPRELGGDDVPSFDLGDGERPPLWDSSGDSLYALGTDGKLWRMDLASGAGAVTGEIPGHRIRALATRRDEPTIWTTDGGRTAWVLVRHGETQQDGFARVDLTTARGDVVLLEEKSYSTVFNVDVAEATGEIVFVARSQQEPGDGWVFDPRTGQTRQVTRLNPDLERYALATARLIEYEDAEGRTLRSALLLPPGYEPGRRLPLFVWVYGGVNGSNSVNRFGFWGTMPTFNMHVLATRGFAVLYPDAPLQEGQPMKDLYRTVMPAVDAAIEQGYADPDRLAVSGQSYGAYSTLALITQTTRFGAAIITAAGVHPVLMADYLTMSPDGDTGAIGYFERGQGNMGGSPWEYPDRYRENSPIYLFDRIDTPLLIGQGDQDGRLLASDAIFVALRRLGKAVEYRIYENEEHVIARKPNVLDFWNRRIEFLDEHLDITRDERGRVRHPK